ncbi:flagellar protein FlhE [Atlantibacter hermannii]|uniref:flagellar protein FlhE n=1 Tax=Atlantibacter hermannii TaxID=565 RepID=UPI0028A7171D|nr:flagellar protein FlhE [Atlantibacter hermannii]
MRLLAGLLLLAPLCSLAAEGAWQSSAVGATLGWRGQAVSSSPLAPSQPVSGLMTLVAWRYELIGPTPAGLQVRLCSLNHCVPIEGQSGTTLGFSNIAAGEPLRFIWEVPGGGKLFPILRVRSNQVIVNYR